jgi:hypothetical protein
MDDHLSRRIGRIATELPKRMRSNVADAAKVLDQAVQETLSVQGTADAPAPPGGPPHRVSGGLQAASGARAEGEAVLVTTSEIGRYQQLGTRRMKARPWLQAALDRSAAAFRAALFNLRR